MLLPNPYIVLVCYVESVLKQWRSQDFPGWASCPPGRPEWGKNEENFKEKLVNLQENEEMLSCPPGSESGYAPVLKCHYSTFFVYVYITVIPCI